MIHLHRLTVYDLAVMLPRRFIHIETVQSFGISLDKGQRCLQLMGHGRNKFFTHLFHFVGFFELYFQFAIRLFELCKGRIQLIGQIIQALAQFPDFIIARICPFMGKIEMGHSNRQLFQMNQRLRQGVGKQDGTDDGDKQPYDTAQGNEILNDDYRRFQRFQRLGNDDIRLFGIINSVHITYEPHLIIAAIDINLVHFPAS